MHETLIEIEQTLLKKIDASICFNEKLIYGTNKVFIILFLNCKKKIADPRIKHILTVVSEVGWKKVLTGVEYSNEKYSLFTWLIVRFGN
jgi:hypothetical protein